MKRQRRRDDAAADEEHFIYHDAKKTRQLFDTNGDQRVVLGRRCVLQHSAVILVIVLLAVLLGFSCWFFLNDASYDEATLAGARPPFA
ncbi:hypothetical protein ABB37_05572 [Leptomonas pyrrhocoris]|uniref:Transmembrane protein n=1 Tax=Leptomonas pyrrhocoris TaxID=157538 RepID=A0A0M9FZG4_LEPPY|nr:hypothetical protein ABB37_05572 [Leptomonas pyrrhocoris]KPA79036.1 hypothetical protein ABB37_05572 [Leptomonas pyrrhocoris]|eukprot:XP_015657475.1 hypothetical protein ABB37_05572 [Leptomonas pyrrhocoris]